MRSFIYQWLVENATFNDKEVNWWLKCEDRSILTQDVDTPDIRRKIIGEKREVRLIKHYNEMFDNFLKVYKNLVKNIKKTKIKDKKLQDLIGVRYFLQITWKEN